MLLFMLIDYKGIRSFAVAILFYSFTMALDLIYTTLVTSVVKCSISNSLVCNLPRGYLQEYALTLFKNTLTLFFNNSLKSRHF